MLTFDSGQWQPLEGVVSVGLVVSLVLRVDTL